MDLAGGTRASLGVTEGFVYLFRNENGTLAKTHYWKNDPPAGRCDALAWGDVNGDGWLDLLKGICGRGGGTRPVRRHLLFQPRRTAQDAELGIRLLHPLQ